MLSKSLAAHQWATAWSFPTRADALTMAPLNLDDNCGAQVTELRKCRSALEGLTDLGARRRGKTAIASLDVFIGKVSRAQSADMAQRELPQ